MKIGVKIGTLLVCLLTATIVALPQDQANGSNEQPGSRLRIDFLLSEYNGPQKISSLPYGLSMEVGADMRQGVGSGRIRMGVKVPIAEGFTAQGVATQFSYQDIGTDIDCGARSRGDGSYDLNLTINRSSVYAETQGVAQTEGQTLRSVGNHPVIQTFRTDFPLRMRDGETVEGTSATDPFSGHVLKVTVTLHVIK